SRQYRVARSPQPKESAFHADSMIPTRMHRHSRGSLEILTQELQTAVPEVGIYHHRNKLPNHQPMTGIHASLYPIPFRIKGIRNECSSARAWSRYCGANFNPV